MARQTFREEDWTPVIGRDAARAYASWTHWVGAAGLLVPIWGVSYFVAHNHSGLTVLPWLVGVVVACVLFRGIIYAVRFRRFISSRFGVKISYRALPPVQDPQKFDAWCIRHDINARFAEPDFH
jgi:hypothetical protein